MTQFPARVGDKIQIGPDITVEITEVRRDRVKLGFTAPADVQILREEIREKILAKYSEGVEIERSTVG